VIRIFMQILSTKFCDYFEINRYFRFKKKKGNNL